MANHGQFTYMASIFHRRQGKFQFNCGGVLITWSHVLTAAHCILDVVKNKTGTIVKVNDRKPENFRIRLGDHSLKEKDHNEERRRVRQLVPHPRPYYNCINDSVCDGFLKLNDIGIIKLQRPVSRFNPYIKPLWPNSCFVKQKPQNGEDVILTGWGFRERPDRRGDGQIIQQPPNRPDYAPDKLRVMETSIANCNNFTNTFDENDQFVCAFEKGRDVGSCGGDSGGWYSFFNQKKLCSSAHFKNFLQVL